MAYLPNLGSPQQVGPQYQYAGQPQANANQGGDPSQRPGYNPFNNRDVFNQYQTIGQDQFQQGQNAQQQYGGMANYYQNAAGGYGQTVQDLYNPIWQGGGGYTPEMQQNILQSQGLDNVAGQLPGNYMTPEEQAGVQGDPNRAYNLYGGQTQFMQSAADQAGQNVQGQAQAGQGHNLAVLGYGQGAVNKAAGDPGLNLSADYMRQAQMSDQQVRDAQESAGRAVGAQFGATKDQLLQNAAAAGNSSPLAIAASMGALDRSSAAGQADAQTSARLRALADQRAAASGIQNTSLQAGQYRAGLGTQAGLNIMNAGLQSNNNLTAQAVDAAKYAGNTSLGQANTNAGNLASLAGQAEQNSSTRAGQLATNRQGVAQGNQQTELGINNATSGRYQAAYNPWVNAQTEGRAAAQGQQQYMGGQANQQTQFGQHAQDSSTAGQLSAAQGYSGWGAGGGQGFGDYLAKSTANSLGQWAGPGAVGGSSHGVSYGSAARGGLLDHHQLLEVGEGDRPEVVLPLMPSTAPMKRNVWEKLGAHLGHAMGLTNARNMVHPHNAFGH